MTTTELGLIEGYYGKPWSASARAGTIAFLAPHGYRFHLHAPKADPYLRRRWQEDHPGAEAEALKALADHCRGLGVRFGIGLSPYEIYRDFGAAEREALARKLAFFEAIGVEELGLFFDDMAGAQADLAEAQARVVDWAAARTGAARITVCPSYYTDDPILDRLFGQRPPAYLETLGQLIDPAIHIFWTGEEVCAREISTAHLARISETLRRKPVLWDNYPVNDGPRMSPHLHLRAFTGRPAAIGAYLSAHAVNPALQPVLTRIPALTLAESYAKGENYEYGRAFARAARAVLGAELGALVREDLLFLQDVGLGRLGATAEKLRLRYHGIDHDGAREIVGWLDGAYRITQAAMEAQ